VKVRPSSTVISITTPMKGLTTGLFFVENVKIAFLELTSNRMHGATADVKLVLKKIVSQLNESE